MFYIFGFFLYNVSLNMKHNLNTKNKLSLGFTLIELLVVIAIIGILSGVVLTSMRNSKTKAINANIQSSLSQLATVAADIDNLQQGGDGNGNCDTLFANPEMQKLVNYAAEQAGREVVYTYCSKSSADYLYTFIAPKVGDDGIYYCVDQHVGIKEVSYGNINSILSSYDCSAEARGEEPPAPPLTIISAVYDPGGAIMLTFNQIVWMESLGNAGNPPVTISDSTGNVFDNGGAGYNAYLTGGSSLSFPVSSPILCTPSATPWGTYSTETHYLSISNVYGAESNTSGSMSVTITCPSRPLYCKGTPSNYNGNCSPNDQANCALYPMCTWNSTAASCNGTPVCDGYGWGDCSEHGCSWDMSNETCSGTPYSPWQNYSTCPSTTDLNTCSNIHGCTLTPSSSSCDFNNKTCSDFSSDNCPTNIGCTVSLEP
jgi:prepilin-type N-terminal cleavage/methylation domain-containing protein